MPLAGTIIPPASIGGGLPNVLIVGDSIAAGYHSDLDTELDTEANVYRYEFDSNDAVSANGLAEVADLAVEEAWDLVLWNHTLHDLYRPTGGAVQTPISDYKSNVEGILDYMIGTGIKTAWITGTPVTGAASPDFLTADVPTYNAVAVGVANARGIPIVDLGAYVTAAVTGEYDPDGVHYTATGDALNAGFMADAIRELLAGLQGDLSLSTSSSGVGATTFGRTPFGRGLFGFDPRYSAEGAPPTEDQYTLEVLDGDGDLLARLPEWGKAQWTCDINRPSLLEFTYLYDSPLRDYLTFPNQILLRDRRGVALDRFRISVPEIGRDPDGLRWIGLTCPGMFDQLFHEELESVSESGTASAVCAALISDQTMTHLGRIQFGSVAISGNAVIEEAPTNIGKCLLFLQELLGGLMWVDPDLRFHWRPNMTMPAGVASPQTIRLNKNLPKLSIRTDYSAIRTSVTVYGKGIDPESRKTATATNNTGTYGTIKTFHHYSDVDDQDTLEALAEQMVQRLSVPTKRISCDTIDLSQIRDGLDHSHEAIVCGGLVTIVDERMGIEWAARIGKTVRDLAVPGAVSIDVQDPDLSGNTSQATGPQKDIIDVIVEAFDLADAFADPLNEESIERIAELIAADADAIQDIADGLTDDATALATLNDAINPGGGAIQYFKILSVASDWLSCKLYDRSTGSVSGDAISVARPFMLQKTPFDGSSVTFPNSDVIEYTYDVSAPTYRREATDGTITEIQVVTPMYFVDEIIAAASGDTGMNDGSADIIWQDLNDCGRHWAREAD